MLGGAGSQAGEAYGQFLQPQSQEDLQGAFQKGVVDPMMQTFQQQTLPGVQQRFVDANAGSSSALNQALSQSAENLTTSLGAQYLPFMQGQQQNTLSALGQLGGLAGAQSFQPHRQEGIAGDLLQTLGTLGAAGITKSSAAIKENIQDYSKGLEVINALTVKKYDFISSAGGEKNRIGLIAETLPDEFRASLDDVNGVDVYGLVGALINAVKELSDKIREWEERNVHSSI